MADIKKASESKVPGPLREDELAELVDAVLQEDDPYRVPPEMIPDGYAVEWKRMTVLGARAPNQASYELNLARTRWEAVDVNTHPSFKPLLHASHAGTTIEKEGMLLMIRPKAVSDKVREIQKMKAQSLLSDKLAQLGNAGNGEAPRKVIGVRRSYEAMEIPDKG